MIAALKRLFSAPGESAATVDTAGREHDIRLATAALLVEVVRADGHVDATETGSMRSAIESRFGLAPHEVDELVRQAERRSGETVSLFELTQAIDDTLSPEEKKHVVELLWRVAFADTRKDALEEQVIRRVAGLLHVPHPDFIDAKIRARGAASPDGGQRQP